MQEPVHDLSGFFPLLTVGSLSIPTYYLVISVTFSVLIVYLVQRTKQHGLDRNTALDLALVIMISGFLGARFLHVIFEEPRYYFEDPLQVFHIERGGFVWYGGAVGGIMGGLLFARFKKLSIAKWLDLSAPIVALGYGSGRIACLLTGCCYGAICNLLSSYRFRYPTQAFAIFWELCVFCALIGLERRRELLQVRHRERRNLPTDFIWYLSPGALFYFWLIGHGVGRMIMELFRADDRGALIFGLSISMWISFVFIGIGVRCLSSLQKSKTA